MSAENGKFQVDDLQNSKYYEIGMKALIDFESGLKENDKDKVLNSELSKNSIKTQKEEKIIIEIQEIDFSMNFRY